MQRNQPEELRPSSDSGTILNLRRNARPTQQSGLRRADDVSVWQPDAEASRRNYRRDSEVSSWLWSKALKERQSGVAGDLSARKIQSAWLADGERESELW